MDINIFVIFSPLLLTHYYVLFGVIFATFLAQNFKTKVLTPQKNLPVECLPELCSYLNVVSPHCSRLGWEVKCLLSDRGRRHPDWETVWGYLPQLRCSFADMQGKWSTTRGWSSAGLTKPERWHFLITTEFIDKNYTG